MREIEGFRRLQAHTISRVCAVLRKRVIIVTEESPAQLDAAWVQEQARYVKSSCIRKTSCKDSNNSTQKEASRTAKIAAEQVSPGREFEGYRNDGCTRQDLPKKRLHRWQRVHVGLFMGAFLCSLAGILAFGMLLKNFELYCPLFANVSVVRDEDSSNASASVHARYYSVDHANSSWGGKRTCDFCLFTTVSSFIYAFLWLWIFCSFSRKVENISVA
ncbi:hypothetical protein HPB51_012469 [Rhipicephalus microplus]|uniref:Uncharacterized protein n=1 Tax=Rhipicephalus microplus TaxID=6941 RepID=A0A9J6E9S7_RHIMP|nr:hypothetical protein HPB51_012469 [Rhipicephalus microplus]